jgi:hypothetical protein
MRGGLLFDYQNAQKVPNGYRFRLTFFREVGTNSVIACGRVVYFWIVKNNKLLTHREAIAG